MTATSEVHHSFGEQLRDITDHNNEEHIMRSGFKKSIAAVAAAAALTLGGGAVANASTSNNLLEIPDVYDMTATAAEQTLEDLGFTTVNIKGSDTDGTAIGTNYQKGVEVDKNAAILVINGTVH
ncbi:PASTA domain-containing protein [Rhodococcus sp. BS-15]|uniref:PASTA domain-containing protein n=1 Tax=Rhodococcus sp. BS-15 TaxID=1304954 RepID=UPI000A77ED90|nr:PASTA domain-containing protein [Rhodococcus sp. BS-15]